MTSRPPNRIACIEPLKDDDISLEGKTLIKVTTGDLLDQWTERMKEYVPGCRVGRIQAESCNAEGCDFLPLDTAKAEQLGQSLSCFQSTNSGLGVASLPRLRCVLCDVEFKGYGNNPSPCAEMGMCCDACNFTKVIPARLEKIQK